MKFSEYVVLDKAGTLIDPLGFLKPSRTLQDLLFEQFTVLSNHPSYHGVLCTIWRCLEQTGHLPGEADYSRRFRRLEILWGLMNAEKNHSVINVNKYKQLLSDRVSLSRIPSSHPIYQRLSYGTLGHYSRPSIAWGLLAPGGRALTPSGHKLATAFSRRNGQELTEWFSRWNAGAELGAAELSATAEAFHLLAKPSNAERTAWRDLIADWILSKPATQAIWDNPVPTARLDAFQQSADAYCSQYAWLSDRYPSLATQIEAIRCFERLSGAVQFVFDLHLASLEFVGDSAPAQDFEREQLAHEIVALAARARAFDARQLFATLAETPKRYADVRNVVAQHHHANQRAKGVSSYFDETGVLVKDKTSASEVGGVLEELANSADADQQMDRLQFRSRRDWHFRRCHTYHSWAFGAPA